MPSLQIAPYLFFNGQCEAAFRRYAHILGARIGAMMNHIGTPAESQVPPDFRTKILHARLDLADGQSLMGSDAPPGRFEKPQGFSISLQIDDPSEAERIFAALAESGQIRMPFAQTFFAQRFGMLIDRFGIPWMINCPPAE